MDKTLLSSLKKINLILMAFAVIVSGCGKDEIEIQSQPPKTAIEKIVGKKWRVTSNIRDGKEVFPGNAPACEQDNVLIFSADGKLTSDNGPTKCSPDDKQVIGSGRFTISNETELTILGNGSATLFILELSESTLKIGTTAVNPRETLTYTAQ